MLRHFIILCLTASVLTSNPILTEDYNSVPIALCRLDQTLSYKTVDDVQWIFKGLSSSNPRVNLNSAHVVWRLLASLYASGDEKAINLYHQLLRSGYQKNNHLLERIGHRWGNQSMNETERNILHTTHSFAQQNPHVSTNHRHAYTVHLLQNQPSTEHDYRRLPMVFWPQRMIDADFDRYIQNSRLRLVVPSQNLKEGLKYLLHNWDNAWRSEADLSEQFFWYMLERPRANHGYHYSFLSSMWTEVCRRKCHINFGEFTQWVEPFLVNTPADRRRMALSEKYHAYVAIDGKPAHIQDVKKWFEQWCPKGEDELHVVTNFSRMYSYFKRDKLAWEKAFADISIWLEPFGLEEQRNLLNGLFFLYIEFAEDTSAMANFLQRFEPFGKNYHHKSDQSTEAYKRLKGALQLRSCQYDAEMTDDEFFEYVTWMEEPWVIELSGERSMYTPWNLLNLYQKFNRGNRSAIERFRKLIPTMREELKDSSCWFSEAGYICCWLQVLESLGGSEQIFKTFMETFKEIIPHLGQDHAKSLEILISIYKYFNGDKPSIAAFFKWAGFPSPFENQNMIQSWPSSSRSFYSSTRLVCFLTLDSLENSFDIYAAMQAGHIDYEELVQNAKKINVRNHHMFQVTNAGLSDDFIQYMQFVNPPQGMHLENTVVQAYMQRAYLPYIRVRSAYMAELNQGNNRLQALFETSIDQPLPMIHMNANRPVQRQDANAHELESIYPNEYQILDSIYLAEHPNLPSGGSIVLYNGKEKNKAYPLNGEIEDFINFVRTHFEEQRVDIIEQVLGLQLSNSPFGSYLGNVMYYGRPGFPQADDFLGKAWWFIKRVSVEESKQLSPDQIEKEQLAIQKSLSLSILESVEQGAMFCQTRVTGEIMKCLCWHLPNSALRGLIAEPDESSVNPLDPQAIAQQRALAHTIAMRKFKSIENSGFNVRQLYEHAESPELWEIYQAFYDDFYMRRRVGETYINNEHTLKRNDLGHLVRAYYNADGTLNPHPVVVYAQEGFTEIELAFTDLLKKNYENKRGVAY